MRKKEIKNRYEKTKFAVVEIVTTYVDTLLKYNTLQDVIFFKNLSSNDNKDGIRQVIMNMTE